MIGGKRPQEHGDRKLTQHNPSGNRGGRWGPRWLRWKQLYSYFYTGVSPAASELYLFGMYTMTKTAICRILPIRLLTFLSSAACFLLFFFRIFYWKCFACKYMGQLLTFLTFLWSAMQCITHNPNAEDRTIHYQTLNYVCWVSCVGEAGVFCSCCDVQKVPLFSRELCGYLHDCKHSHSVVAIPINSFTYSFCLTFF